MTGFRWLDANWNAVAVTTTVALAAVLVHATVSRGLRAAVSGGHVSAMMARRLAGAGRAVLATLVVVVTLAVFGWFADAWAVLSTVALTVAVGFVALWSVLSNFVCAILIVIYRPFRLGDFIEVVETGAEPLLAGTVHDLSLLYTTVEEEGTDEQRVLVRIPNSLLLQKAVRVRMARGSAPGGSFFGPLAPPNQPPAASDKA